MAWIEETGKTIYDETNVALEGAIKKFGASSAYFIPSKRLRCAANSQFYFADYKNFTIDFWLGIDRNIAGGILSIGAGSNSALSLQLDGIGGLKWLSGNMTTSVGIFDICNFTQQNANAKGYIGGFIYGNYAYLVPYNNGSFHGLAIRIPLNNLIPSAIEVCDFTQKNTNAKGYIGAFTDGTYAYYAPNNNGSAHGLAVRVPLNNFVPSAIEICDLTQKNSGLKGFNGCFSDGTYAYYVPFNNGSYHGLAVRVPLNNFVPSAATICDFTQNNANAKGYHGGFSDGTYAYFVPRYNGSYHGLAVRVPLNNFIPSAATICDFTQNNANAKGYIDGFTDGTYAYYSPFNNGSAHGLAVRVPLNNFVPSAIEICDFTQNNANAKGYHGTFKDNTYAYYVSNSNGLMVRVPLNNFVSSAIQINDFAQKNTNCAQYHGGFSDGDYAYYYSPYNTNFLGLINRLRLDKWTNSNIVCGSGYIQMAHVAWVRKYGIDYLYINGLLQDTNNSTINYGNGDLYINDKPDGSYSGCYIYIDELAIRSYPIFNGNFTPPSSAYTYP